MIDIIFAILIVIGCIKGYKKGFIIALFSIIAFIIGLAAALKLSVVVAGYFRHNTTISGKWLPFISFILVFVLVAFLVNLCGKFIEKTLQMTLLGFANRIGGVLLYMVLYTIIFSVFLFYFKKIHLLTPSLIQSSWSYSFIEPLGPKVIDGLGKIIPLFKDMFKELEDFFGALANKIQH